MSDSPGARPGDHSTGRSVDVPIVVTGVVFRDDAGRVLVVRKRGTSRVMLPGGKPELGERAAAAGVRECREEVGADVGVADLRLLGVFDTPAANEDGRRIEATVYLAPGVPDARPAAEIEHVEWLDPALPRDDLAPLLTDAVWPALARLDQSERASTST